MYLKAKQLIGKEKQNRNHEDDILLAEFGPGGQSPRD